MFYPPEGLCRAEPLRGPIVFTYVLFGLGKVYGVSKTHKVQKLIGFLKIFEPRKCFIPRREIRSISSRGPIVFTYVLFWVREGILHFQKSIRFLKIFEPRKCFIVTGGRVDGWTGGRVGRSAKRSFNFFHFKIY